MPGAVSKRSRTLDGVCRDKQPLLSSLKRQSLSDTLWRVWRKSEIGFRRATRLLKRLAPDLAPHKLLYVSLVGGVAFGVVSMALMEQYFGPGVFARSSGDPGNTVVVQASAPALPTPSGADATEYRTDSDAFLQYFSEAEQKRYEDGIREMVKGYPIESMLPYIFEKDRVTAAFLIGIAKKESNWGKRVPVLDGQDCFNYWGYRGIRRLMGTGGHTCFNSPKDAVDTVATRLGTLINSQKLDTPEKMVVWKCGFSCQGQSRESVLKWISDVDLYFSQLDE